MKAPRCSFYFDLISKRKKGFFASFLRSILSLLSFIFACAVFLRKVFHKKPFRPKAFTISIGNIVAGGTGKTPFAIFLARRLLEKHSVGIVIRGYKAQIEKSQQTYVFQKEAPCTLVGDEACLIARELPDVVLFCGKNKVESAKLADAQGIHVVVVDDGFQHIALERDVDIVMIDSLNPFGYGHLLPRGLLREPISALKRASLVVITCRNGIDVPVSVVELIGTYTKAPICKVRFKSVGLFSLHDILCDLPADTKVGLMCAIAKPDQFVATIAALGLDIVYSEFLDDHEPFNKKQLHDIAQKAKAKGATCLICTQKDAVKFDKDIAADLPIYWLKIEIEMMGPDILDRLFVDLNK